MTISVDFDGTLAIGDSFEIALKQPNKDMISKVNQLKESGCTILIVTARGAKDLSVTERELKYTEQISSWLNFYQVKYDKISFLKEYADLYIDDLSLNVNIKTVEELSKGFTENKVYRVDDYIWKQGSTIADELLWYRAFKKKEHIPKIYSINRTTLCMEYIQHQPLVDLKLVTRVIDSYMYYPRMNDLSFGAYIDNIHNHVVRTGIHNGAKLLCLLRTMEIQPTFAHGDLSIENILVTVDGKVKLIDPLYCERRFGSYILDIAKLLFTLKFFKEEYAMFDKLKEEFGYVVEMDCLIASEALRVASYKPQYKFIAENLINEL